jgi:hypothetical protein
MARISGGRIDYAGIDKRYPDMASFDALEFGALSPSQA